MRRRAVVAGLCSVTATWPLGARAQQPKLTVGYLTSRPFKAQPHLLEAFRKGLETLAFVEGQNLAIEYRSAEDRMERLPQLIADLVSRRVSAICATGNPAAALAVKRMTDTIPIVFTAAANPVELGLVASLNRPGGNVTGVSFLSGELSAKRLELLHELVPGAVKIAALVNPQNPSNGLQILDFQEAARKRNIQIGLKLATTPAEIDAAFETMIAEKPEALLVGVDPMFTSQREQIVSLTARGVIPTCFPLREFVDVGGLMSYGASLSAAHQLAGEYTGRILKGERPADMPVQQSTRFELFINLKTAKALGIEVPPMLLARADEVIE